MPALTSAWWRAARIWPRCATNGLKLLIGDEARVAHPRCTDKAADLGVQDFVIICLKAHSITGVLDQMQPLLGEHTRIVTAVNGIPYWYFYKHGGAHEARRWRASIPAAGSGASSARTAPSAASCIPRPRSRRPA